VSPRVRSARWRSFVISQVTRINRTERGKAFRKNLLAGVSEYESEGDLRLIDVSTSIVQSLRFVGRTSRYGLAVSVLLFASLVVSASDERAREVRNVTTVKYEIVAAFRAAPRPLVHWTSLSQGISCIEVKRSDTASTISIGTFCYPTKDGNHNSEPQQ
jgi:hypothetical protein